MIFRGQGPISISVSAKVISLNTAMSSVEKALPGGEGVSSVFSWRVLFVALCRKHRNSYYNVLTVHHLYWYIYIYVYLWVVMVRVDGNSNESRTCHLTRYEFCVVLFSRARITRLLGLKFGIPKAQHIWCFWVVIHVAVEYCWTMLNPYPRISNKWNNYTFKCQVFFSTLHAGFTCHCISPLNPITPVMCSFHDPRWVTGVKLCRCLHGWCRRQMTYFWNFGEAGDETITPRDVSGCKLGRFFKFKFWGTEKRGGKWAIKIPWFQRMEVNQWIQWAFYMIYRNYKRHMVSVTSKSTQRISTATVHLWFRKLWYLTASVAALQCQPASNKASGNSSWPFLGWISDPFKG